MDASRFDALSRSLGSHACRRGLLGGVLVTLGRGVLPLVNSEAKQRHRRTKRKKLQRNEFGCISVGRACRGKDTNCCSGICKGKKPKKGEKDKSKCVGHDASTCLPGQMESVCGGTDLLCTTSTGDTKGLCETTTGNAAYCVANARCWPCSKDADCHPFCGLQAACFRCAGFCADTGGTVCGGQGNCPGFPPLPP